MLKRISPRDKQLWVVAYVNQKGDSPLLDEAFWDLENAMEGGADAVVFINEWSSHEELKNCLDGVRKKYQGPLGVNYLPKEASPDYGTIEAFSLAKDYSLQIVWTDFSGVDLIKEKPEISLHTIENQKCNEFFYCSGIHMKYSNLIDPNKPIEKSALQAMGWLDGIIMTGPKTGIAVDVDKLKRARAVLGNYPLGLASGVSPENAEQLAPHADFFLVASSLQKENFRIDGQKVKRLRRALGE